MLSRSDNNDFNIKRLDIKAPSATWTYLVSDNPFENKFGLQLSW